MIKRTAAVVGRKIISGYSLTQRGLAKVKPTLPYEIKTKDTRSEYLLHDIALHNIRKAFAAKATVQGYQHGAGCLCERVFGFCLGNADGGCLNTTCEE